jgi:hypothetical protein
MGTATKADRQGRPRLYDEDELVAVLQSDYAPDELLELVEELVADAGVCSPRTALQLRRWLAGKVYGVTGDRWSMSAEAKYRGALARVASELPTRPRRAA